MLLPKLSAEDMRRLGVRRVVQRPGEAIITAPVRVRVEARCRLL